MDGMQRIAIDAMSGDNGLEAVIPAAIMFLREFDDSVLILTGDEAQIQAELDKHKFNNSERLRIHHASQVVAMDESPALALRGKKDSSMRVAINLVKDGEADAAISAGNTGALMATGRFVLKTLDGIDRPAICTSIPKASGHTYMLDLGANIDSTSEHLYQFAVMGSELVRAIDGREDPRIGLLNIGAEELKGNEQVKQAHDILKNGEFNYIGFVEGDDIYQGDADVIVCDGFVGNVALKTSEGLAKMLSDEIKAGYSRNLFTKLAAVISWPVIKGLRSRFDHRSYNGASLLGLKGIVIKSHGGADDVAFANAIKIARKEIIEKVPERIEEHLQKHLHH